MLKLLERHIAAVDQRLVVLAPPNVALPRCLGHVTCDSVERQRLLSDLQRLRGRTYLKDGAIQAAQLTPDGRHVTPEDEKSWHLLLRNENGSVSGCIWYLEHSTLPSFEQLRLRHTALAHDHHWGHKLREAVRSHVECARQERIRYAEVGGWAVAEDSRLPDCLLLVLSTFGLSQALGGALVVATATVRNASAAVLQRLGGSHLAGDGYVVPPYHEPRYGCQMEILRFDTRQPTAKFKRMVDYLREKLYHLPVVGRDNALQEERWEAKPSLALCG